MLQISLLGPFAITYGGVPITGFPTDKTRGLLAYLALEPMRPHRREHLAALFWPDCSHQSALYNLRLTLHRLRKTLAQAAPMPAARLFTVTRQTILFAPTEREVQVDALAFQILLLDCERHTHVALAACAACVQRLEQAAALYRGELLAGFGLADAPGFEEWLLLRRETLHQQALLLLSSLADAHEMRREYEKAHTYAARCLALDAYREGAHRQIMRLLAARGLAHEALLQYERCRRLLREELGTAPDAETTQLARQIQTGTYPKQERRSAGDGEPAGAALLVPSTSIPTHNLPALSTPIIGREREIADLAAVLQQPAGRLVTLVGAGGIGKTRLALAVAQLLLTAFADGVYFVSLASIAEPSVTASTIAAAIELTWQGDVQLALRQALRAKSMLLILDNCEHLLQADHAARPMMGSDSEHSFVQVVMDILASAPGVRLLATSRERLSLHVEQVYMVEAMALAEAAELDTAAKAAAVRLFVERVQRVQPRFTLRQNNLQEVLRVCSLVQGMPLGLELAADWANRLDIAEIADEIGKSADFLAAEWHDMPARQRSMRAVFEWSWRLLDAEEQAILRRLAAFRGSFTREAAAAVTGAPARVLASLVNKSLLNYAQPQTRWESKTQALGAGRYQLHELLRQFLAEQLAAAPAEADAVAELHSQYYLDLVSQREQRLARHDAQAAAAEIQAEIDNVWLAWQTAAHRQQLAALDASASALWFFCEFAGLGSQGAQVFHYAAEQISDPAANEWLRNSVYCKLLAMESHFLIGLSHNEQALLCARRAIAIGQAVGRSRQQEIEGETLGHFVQGQALRRMGRSLEAHREFERAVELVYSYHRERDLLELLLEVESKAYGWLCSIALNPLHDYQAAKTYAQQKLQLGRRFGKRSAEIAALTDFVDIAVATGDFSAAQRYCEQALEQANQIGNRRLEASAHEELGGILEMQGDYWSSFRLRQTALAGYREMGSTIGEFNILASLLRLCTLMGDFTAAHRWYDQFVRLGQTVEPPLGEYLDCLLARTLLASYSGDLLAETYAEQSHQLAERIGDPLRLAHALVLMARVCASRQQDAAIAACTQALEQYATLNDKRCAVEAQACLAQILWAQGNLAEAGRQVEAILPVLADSRRVGINEPFEVYLNCHRVLAANQDPRSAALLQRGYELLQRYASRIHDEALRRSFLENVEVHNELRRLYLARRAADDAV